MVLEDSVKRNVFKLYERGVKPALIQRQFGISKGSYYNIINENLTVNEYRKKNKRTIVYSESDDEESFDEFESDDEYYSDSDELDNEEEILLSEYEEDDDDNFVSESEEEYETEYETDYDEESEYEENYEPKPKQKSNNSISLKKSSLYGGIIITSLLGIKYVLDYSRQHINDESPDNIAIIGNKIETFFNNYGIVLN